ncbi:hypothetical protein IWQ61_003106 [Dispira simplex]|nr:hypothetical protein IWQ61_003106 [Dispira simplex]
MNGHGGMAKSPLPEYGYPKVFRDDQFVEMYHGQPVKDPYRWLESSDDPRTKQFIKDQMVSTKSYLEQYSDRKPLKNLVTKLFNYERRSAPYRYGDYYYFYVMTGDQAHEVWYQQRTLQDKPRVFLDVNTLSDDGSVSMGWLYPSWDGVHFAVMLSANGSDWSEIHIMRADTPEEMTPAEVRWVKFSSVEWTKDNLGFFYTRFPQPKQENGGSAGTETDTLLNCQVYYHRIGTPQEEDVLVYHDPEHPSLIHQVTVSDDPEHRYLILCISQGASHIVKVAVADLNAYPEITMGPLSFTFIVDRFEYTYDFVTCHNSTLYFQSDADAPRGCLLTIDMDQLDLGFRTLIPEHPRDNLLGVKCIHHDYLGLRYLRNAITFSQLFCRKSGALLGSFQLSPGSVHGLVGKADKSEIFFVEKSYVNPSVIYRYDLAEHPPTPRPDAVLPLELAPQEYYRTKLCDGLDLSHLCTTQVWYPSKDGTRVSMFILGRKGLTLDGSHPTLLYGYGGFNTSLLPTFSLRYLTFVLAYDGVVAVANLRGGGEYGKEWHKQGMKHKKQNVLDDFCAAARCLIDRGYTCPERLVSMGGSNGGLLVSACANQEPELFGCVLSQVGVLDMLRFHKFTIGHAWITEYGNPDEPKDFSYLYKYSPLHNIQCRKPYPAMLLLTADHDDRVSPLHSFKYAAALQYVVGKNAQQIQPLMIHIETAAGHGSGKSTQKVIEETVTMFSFAAHSLGFAFTGPQF